MIERKPFYVQHRDGTSTILGAKDHSFSAFVSPSHPISEGDIESKIKQVSLPFEDRPATIVGWGGFSVAVRLENSLSPDTTREVVIFRPLSPEDSINPLKKVSLSWQNEQTVNQQFTPFTIPQHLVIVNGIDGKPTALKVAKEVEGATFKDSSLLAVLNNTSVLEQYIQFCRKALGVFISEGKLVDSSGHLARNKLRQVWIGMVPFYSDNLMIEYCSNKLVFVDCDVKPSIHFFHKADWLQKMGILMRAGFMEITAVAAKTFTLAHRARDLFFEEDYTKINRDRIKSSEEYRNFTGGLREIVQTLNDAEVNYRVVGSIGIAGIIQSGGGEFYLTPKRVNQSGRDVDIIVLDHNSEKIARLQKYLIERSKKIKGYPPASLVTPIEIDENTSEARYPHDRILPTEITKVGIDQGGKIYQVYKDLVSVIDGQLLESVIVEYEGIPFPTMAPGVLAGYYLTRGGNFKLKDLKKIEVLFAYEKFHVPVEFRDFAQTIRHSYPKLYRNFLVRELLNYWSGGLISGGRITKFVDYLKLIPV